MSIKLLLADDSITIQKVIGIIFGGDDYSLTVVDNGKSAIDKALELDPDVLVIDALMPGMSGYEVCETVRATPALASKPILILTGSFEPFDEDKARKCGADDFLAKPFESQQIVNKVRELAELGSSRLSSLLSTETAASSATTESAAPPESIAASVPAAEELQESAPSDIWGAFTPDTEMSPSADLTPESSSSTLSDTFETDVDVFAMINEDSDSQLVQSEAAPSTSSHQHTGTQWIPVEEHTFEFEEEKIAEIPQPDFTVPPDSDSDSGFGEIVFEEEAPVQTPTEPVEAVEPAEAVYQAPEPEAAPVFEPFAAFDAPVAEIETVAPVIAAPAAASVEPAAVPVAESVPAAGAAGVLSEEQLKAAIMAASKEVIERIVWEVVPDLAEALIRDAIRKIKEGV
ncbi:MAG: response regulator [Deltaproteobacteria bacterium]|nr:response regulator [Deltaproteobacteria bacterium]